MRHGRMTVTAWLAAALAAGLAAGASAQSQPPKVLQDDQVTEENLVDALKPVDAEQAGIRTRTLRIGPAGGQATGAQTGSAAAPARRDVSLLVTFVINSARLTAHAQRLLDVVGRALNSDQLVPLKFSVEGHADPRGTAQGNLVLSQARAESVRKYLISEHGIDGARLFAVGKGDTELLNKSVPTAPENRRVTLVTRVD
jgi:OOP family OmpA-OmpF porin